MYFTQVCTCAHVVLPNCSFVFYYYLIVSEKLAEAMRKFSTLKSELDLLSNTAIKMKDYGKKFESNKLNLPQRKVQELKLAFSEFYLSLILLQNYQNLNYTGFKKILKKHDKVCMFRHLLFTVHLLTYMNYYRYYIFRCIILS